jgi:hypothetical protein
VSLRARSGGDGLGRSEIGRRRAPRGRRTTAAEWLRGGSRVITRRAESALSRITNTPTTQPSLSRLDAERSCASRRRSAAVPIRQITPPLFEGDRPGRRDPLRLRCRVPPAGLLV